MGNRAVVVVVVRLARSCNVLCHSVIAIQHGNQCRRVGIRTFVAINDVDPTDDKTFRFGERLLRTHAKSQAAAQNKAIDALAELAGKEVVGDGREAGGSCRAVICRTEYGRCHFPDVIFHAMLCVKAVYLHLVETFGNACRHGLRDVEGATVLDDA